MGYHQNELDVGDEQLVHSVVFLQAQHMTQ